MKLRRRSTQEIRESLRASRRLIDEDLDELESRVQENMSPTRLLARHPVLFTAAGALLGLMVVRNPAFLGRSLVRLAQVSTPLLLRSFLRRG
jgi:hypothetical protein